MKVLQPIWVHHDDKPIFSVDIHPNGDKFATGGQGGDSGRVIIWNLAPVISEKAELDKTIPKIMCQMDNHLACVNCVRWSCNGLMLASGGDDKLVMIWKRSAGGGGGVFGSSGISKHTENWRCIATLRGHGGDVLDVAWSPQDRWLATCSVDNTIIIWDAQQLPVIVGILKGHTGLVKGVTWDPVGKFLASQSDDRTLKIWKTSDWSCSTTITEPFEECGGTTHVLRLSWSPDGQYLVSAHAMNGGGPTAQIIERDGWKCENDFVGHRKAVTCVRFHNSILKRKAPQTNKPQQYCCLAIGARDRSLSIWLTALQRPLVVIHDLFQDSVLDLSWSIDGYTLLACSGDGKVACIQFSADELGVPLSEDDKNCLYQRMYGKNANIDITVQAEKEMIIENADLLNATKNKLKVPTLIPEAELKLPPPEHTIEKENISNNMETNSVPNASPVRPILKQIESKTADGKRRITPMFIPLTDDYAGTNTGTVPSQQFSSSSTNVSSITVERVAVPTTSSKEKISIIGTNAEQSAKLDNRLTKAAPGKTSTIPTDSAIVSAVPPASQNRTEYSRPQQFMAGKALAIQGAAYKSIGEYRLQISNEAIKTAFGTLCKVLCLNVTLPATDRKNWETFIGSSIVSFACCQRYILLCSLDATIRFLDIKTGSLVLPVLSVSSPAVQSTFSSNSNLGGILTENGLLRIWNIKEESIYLSAPCVDILNGHYANMMYISDTGSPFITLNNGTSYSYCKKLDSWLVLNSNDPVVRYGLTTSNTKTNTRNMKNYPLTTVQSIGNSCQSKSRNFVDLQANVWQTPAILSFIENQIKLCEMINSPAELKHWYSMLGYQLAQHGSEKKVRQILDDLLGPAFSLSLSNSESNSALLGLSKHRLLEDILINLKSQTKWQRIFMEYSEQLKYVQMEARSYEHKSGMDTS